MNNHMQQITAVVHHGQSGEGGFWATCMEVPGAHGQGETKAECLADLKKSVQFLMRTKRDMSRVDSARKLWESTLPEMAGAAWLHSLSAANNPVSPPPARPH